jgi:dTDP-4-dehydrorhamnose 3,5-epimerase
MQRRAEDAVDAAGIAGVELIRLEAHADDRGSLVEAYRVSRSPGLPVVQANVSSSVAGVLRGLHFHREQSDYWVPLEGRAVVGLYDLRVGSPTTGRAASIPMDAAEASGLFIPPGVAHGFATHTAWRMLYLVDVEFTGDDEFGIAWNDPSLGIDWSVEDPVVSERDRSNPSLAEVLAADPPTFRG